MTGQPSCVAGSTLDERKNPPTYFLPTFLRLRLKNDVTAVTVAGDRDPLILRIVGILIFDVKFK